MREFEFAILGAGAMGSILGAHLARAGRSVVMLARTPRAQQIERLGVRVEGLVTIVQAVPVLTDASQLRSAQVLIVATKTDGTAAALALLRGATIGSALSIQNGLMKDIQLAECFGKEHVLGALADASGELMPGGDVKFTRNANIYIGELDGGHSARTEQVANAIDVSGVRSRAVADIQSLEWSKFASWVGMMALSVITRSTTWRYVVDSASALVLIRLVREIGQLAEARHIRLSDESPLPVATICSGSEEQALRAVQRVGLQLKEGAPEHRMSTLQDLEAGRPLEVEETLGYAIWLAQQSGVSLPLLDSVYRLVVAIDHIRG